MILSTNTKEAIKHTYHCLIGCGIGEILGMLIASALGWHKIGRISLALILAFSFGYGLTYIGLIRKKYASKDAARITLATDSVSILSMEIIDNTVELIIPNALMVSASSFRFWWGLLLSLGLAFLATVPVNKWMISRASENNEHHHHH